MLEATSLPTELQPLPNYVKTCLLFPIAITLHNIVTMRWSWQSGYLWQQWNSIQINPCLFFPHLFSLHEFRHNGHGKISCLENFIYMCRCGYVLGRNAVGKIHGEMAFGKCGWGNTIGEMLLSKTLLGITIVTLLEIGRVQNNKIIDPTGVPP